MPNFHMNTPMLILASASPRRTNCCANWEMDFKVVPSEAGEIHHDQQLTAHEVFPDKRLPESAARGEEISGCARHGRGHVGLPGNRLFGKPATLEAAYEMLERLQGRTHHVVTAICLLHLREHRQRIFAESTAVTFRALDAVKIRAT